MQRYNVNAAGVYKSDDGPWVWRDDAIALEAENKRLRSILAREVDDGRPEVDDIGVDAWIEQALKGNDR